MSTLPAFQHTLQSHALAVTLSRTARVRVAVHEICAYALSAACCSFVCLLAGAHFICMQMQMWPHSACCHEAVHRAHCVA